MGITPAEKAVSILTSPVDLSQALKFEGHGPFVSGYEMATLGTRTVTADVTTGAIVSESFDTAPRPNRLTFGGSAAAGSLVVTFDGLPEQDHLEPLLQILMREGVHATFFVDARAITANKEGLAQILTNGFCVGLRITVPLSLPGADGRAEDLLDNFGQMLLARETGQQAVFVRLSSDDQSWATERANVDALIRQLGRGYLPVAPGLAAPYGPFNSAEFVARVRDEAASTGIEVIDFELENGNAA